MTETPADVSPHATAHEDSDINVGAINVFLKWLVVSLLFVGVVVYWQYNRYEKLAQANDAPPSPRIEERKKPNAPGLLIDELTNQKDFMARQLDSLQKTAWVSKDEKVVQIPIDRAIEQVVKNGLPKWQAPPVTKP